MGLLHFYYYGVFGRYLYGDLSKMVATGLESSYVIIYILVMAGNLFMLSKPFHFLVNFMWGLFGFVLSGLLLYEPSVMPFYPYLSIFLGVFAVVVMYVGYCSYTRSG